MESQTLAQLNIQGQRPPIEVKVYRQWRQRTSSSFIPQYLSCILLDRQGNAIQANMDIREAQYFENILRVGSAFEISKYFCEETKVYQQTLQNKITLRFGRITKFEPIPPHGFPDHFFNFVAYNQLESRIANPNGDLRAKNPMYTDYIAGIKDVDDINTRGSRNTIQIAGKTIYVENLNGKMVEIKLWGQIAEAFDKDA